MSNTETFGFQTEVKQLLQLMIHSLYSNKEIFLRELISNASDAEDKLRFLSVEDPKLLEQDPELKITIDFDETQKTLSVTDNGIGMNRQEIIENLGTIAQSGTKKFLNTLTGDQNKDMHLIGQFGVGFYSAFMVANKIVVTSRKAGTPKNQGVLWESTGDGQFTVSSCEQEQRGTTVTLHLREEDFELLNHFRLQSIIHKYSDHIMFPILLKEDKGTDTDKTPGFTQINSAKALWTRSKNEITATEYEDFYKHIAHDFQNPLCHLHFKVEGKQEYTALLFIPAAQPFNLFDREHKAGLKLFIQRVFIMDNADILPNYLRFVKGIVDSNDLPLNVSRELLQKNAMIEKMKANMTKKILGQLKKMSDEDHEQYQNFYKNFGVVLKEGFSEDFQNQQELAELLRFNSTFDSADTLAIKLSDYVKRMKPEQKHIYYIIADNFIAAKNSPHLEIFRKKGIEVLLLADRVDEWMMAYLREYEGKTFKSITKDDVLLDEFKDQDTNNTKDETKQPQLDALLKKMQELLTSRVKEVRISKRLTDSPSCLVADAQDMSLHLQRLMQQAGQMVPTSAPILEINAQHPLVERLLTENDQIILADWSQILFEQALLAEGGNLSDPNSFVQRINKYLK
jgi:molecular chaperone HtpG